jgi:hypothetical protein
MYMYVYEYYMYCFVSYMVRLVATGPLRKHFSNDVYKMPDYSLDDRACSVVAFQKISIIKKSCDWRIYNILIKMGTSGFS